MSAVLGAARPKPLPSHPLPGERLLLETRLHGVMVAVPALLLLAAAALGLAAWGALHRPFIPATALLVAAALFLLPPYLLWRTTELGVTTARVLIRSGVIRRRVRDVALGDVQSIGVAQGVVGRIGKFGTVTIIGSGGARVQLRCVAGPQAFQQAVQRQFASAAGARLPGISPSP